MSYGRIVMSAALLAVLSAGAMAENVDLVTLPRRDRVQLTIYNSEDITLVRETRQITLKQGMNELQFSWAGTLIDPTSVEFRVVEPADRVELVHTLYPGQKPQHLIWQLDSQVEGQVTVEVSYFTSGLTWSMDYVGITDSREREMDFRGYVRVFNNSGEQYEDAEIRLIVGSINLVERIAELARRGVLAGGEVGRTRQMLARKSFAKAEEVAADSAGAMPAPSSAPKGVVKEGVSEYFMFSIEGTETIETGWSKRMQAAEALGIPFEVVYRMREHQYGPRPVRFFLWRNDQEHKLGESPLPDGRVVLFRRNGQDGLSLLGRQQVRYSPIQAEIEVNLGPDDLVVYRAQQGETDRLNFDFRRVNDIDCVVGWDEKQEWIHEIRNYRAEPIRFELRRQWQGDVEFESEIRTTLFDYQTTEVELNVPSEGGEVQYPATVTLHHGKNAKQSRVRLK